MSTSKCLLQLVQIDDDDDELSRINTGNKSEMFFVCILSGFVVYLIM